MNKRKLNDMMDASFLIGYAAGVGFMVDQPDARDVKLDPDDEPAADWVVSRMQPYLATIPTEKFLAMLRAGLAYGAKVRDVGAQVAGKS